jgi:hypothetical protein
MSLTREFLLERRELPRRQVDLSEFFGPGSCVYVRELSGAERDQYEARLTDPKLPREQALRNARALLVALAAVDEQGGRIFGDTDVVELGRQSARMLDKVWAAARKLSGLDREAEEEEGKSSTPTPLS